MDEAVFTRTDTPNGVRFDVTPAAAMTGTVLFMKSGMGCLGVINGLILGIIGWGAASFVLPAVLSVILGLAVGDFVGSWAAFAVGVLIFIWRLRRYTKPLKQLDIDRRPVSLTVSPNGIQYPGGLISRSDIADMAVRNPYDRGGYEINAIVGDGEGIEDAARRWGIGKGTEVRNRAFALLVRRKSISTPVIVAQGLTWNTGQALLNDVRQALQ